MTAFEKMVAFIEKVRGAVHQHNVEDREAKLKALRSLVKATTETRQYLAAVRRDPAAKNFNKQAELATLWGEAAFDIHTIDPELANVYLRKSDYWSDPEGWTEAQKDEREIQLDAISERGRKALL
jgi:hypothetical protein